MPSSRARVQLLLDLSLFAGLIFAPLATLQAIPSPPDTLASPTSAKQQSMSPPAPTTATSTVLQTYLVAQTTLLPILRLNPEQVSEPDPAKEFVPTLPLATPGPVREARTKDDLEPMAPLVPELLKEARTKDDHEPVATLVDWRVAAPTPPAEIKPPAKQPDKPPPREAAKLNPDGLAIGPPTEIPQPLPKDAAKKPSPTLPEKLADEIAQELSAAPAKQAPIEAEKKIPEVARARTAGPIWPQIFDMAETRSDNLRPFTKWTWMLDRYSKEKPQEVASCNDSTCRLQSWRQFLETLKGKSREQQLDAINSYANRHPYIEDLPNYGVPDYWATPREFLQKDGDCEDYAITKYWSLRALGFQDDELRLVVVQDMNLGVAHAVLLAYSEGKALLLDNQIKSIVDSAKIHHYRPFFSINEQHWWLHKPDQPKISETKIASPRG